MTVVYTKSIDDFSKVETIFRTDEDGKVWAIPTDPANSDYQAYLTSLENTDTPTA